MSFGCDELFKNALKVNFEVHVPDHEKIEFWCDVFVVVFMLCVADQGVDVLEKAGSVFGRIRSDSLILKLPVMSGGKAGTLFSRILVEPSLFKGHFAFKNAHSTRAFLIAISWERRDPHGTIFNRSGGRIIKS